MIHVGDRLVISPGLRVDLFAEEGTEALFVEPRLDLLFKLSDTLALRGDGGRYAQMPSLPVSVPGFEAFGLADLGAQTSLGGSLGIEARLPGHLTLGVTGYYQKLRVSDVRNIDIEQNDPPPPTSWWRATARPTAPSSSCGALTPGVSSAGWPTRSRGVSATTTAACSAVPTGTSGTS